jgi:hypothetical protein
MAARICDATNISSKRKFSLENGFLNWLLLNIDVPWKKVFCARLCNANDRFWGIGKVGSLLYIDTSRFVLLVLNLLDVTGANAFPLSSSLRYIKSMLRWLNFLQVLLVYTTLKCDFPSRGHHSLGVFFLIYPGLIFKLRMFTLVFVVVLSYVWVSLWEGKVLTLFCHIFSCSKQLIQFIEIDEGLQWLLFSGACSCEVGISKCELFFRRLTEGII